MLDIVIFYSKILYFIIYFHKNKIRQNTIINYSIIAAKRGETGRNRTRRAGIKKPAAETAAGRGYRRGTDYLWSTEYMCLISSSTLLE